MGLANIVLLLFPRVNPEVLLYIPQAPHTIVRGSPRGISLSAESDGKLLLSQSVTICVDGDGICDTAQAVKNIVTTVTHRHGFASYQA